VITFNAIWIALPIVGRGRLGTGLSILEAISEE